MRYVPLPASVVPAAFIGTLLLLAWLGWESSRDPETWWAPGDLSRAHADVASCLQCHQPFKGPTSRNCVACHGEAQFARQSSPDVAAAHTESVRGRGNCLACHTEHRGVLTSITIGALHNPHGEYVFRATGARNVGRLIGVDEDAIRIEYEGAELRLARAAVVRVELLEVG